MRKPHLASIARAISCYGIAFGSTFIGASDAGSAFFVPRCCQHRLEQFSELFWYGHAVAALYNFGHLAPINFVVERMPIQPL